MNKEELRKSALSKRQQHSDEECTKMSADISDLFFLNSSFDLSTVSYLHLFLPIGQHKEVDTYPIFRKLLERYSSTRIVLSKCDFSQSSMSHFLYTEDTVLKKNRYGIPEPVSGLELKAAQLDMVLVPLLVFDTKGNRIGYGKGFYDRFLSECRPDCKKVGLSFSAPIEEIKHEDFDVKLDFCITPEKVYHFKNIPG